MQTTKEEIEKALKEFPESKQALKSLFGEYFEQRRAVIIVRRERGWSNTFTDATNTKVDMIGVGEDREGSTASHFWLNSGYDWKLEQINGHTVLIPLKKE